jgi:alpha-galactosidase
MSLWCILAAPLFAGNDLTQMSRTTLETLTNQEVIAIDQDAAGVQGHRVWQEGPTQAWLKALADGTKALVVLNTQNRPTTVTVSLKKLGLPDSMQARDLWLRKDLGTFHQHLTVSMARHGAVLLKISADR